MADFEDRLRETLKRRAVAVPPHLEVPPGLVQRAWVRIARNVSAVLFALAVVAIGAVSGVHALSGPRQDRPATSPQPAPACQAANLSGASNLEITDPTIREGSLEFTNDGVAACSLQGRPVVRVLNVTGAAASLGSGTVAPFWMIRGVAQPPDWPVVTLHPGDKAKIHVKWISWCGQGGDPTTWQIELAGSGGKVEFSTTRKDIPICVGLGKRPILKVGPFEPYSI